MPSIRTALRREDGITILELSISMLVLAILGGIMLTWAVAVTRHDELQLEETVALDEMRGAKATLVRELRYADSVTSITSHQAVVVVDGATVTWSVGTDGTLTRTDGTVTETRARNLVYDSGPASDSSWFAYDATDAVVTVHLVADVEAGEGISPRTIQTQVQLRDL